MDTLSIYAKSVEKIMLFDRCVHTLVDFKDAVFHWQVETLGSQLTPNY